MELDGRRQETAYLARPFVEIPEAGALHSHDLQEAVCELIYSHISDSSRTKCAEGRFWAPIGHYAKLLELLLLRLHFALCRSLGCCAYDMGGQRKSVLLNLMLLRREITRRKELHAFSSCKALFSIGKP
jgi:hypothetical protein